MKKQPLWFLTGLFIIFLLYSFSSKNLYSTGYKISTDNFNPKKFYKKQCSFCHNSKGKIGPPMEIVKATYMSAYPNSNEFIKKMTSFILNPLHENRLIKNNEGIYGTMPKGMFKDSLKIDQVVKYIYTHIPIHQKKQDKAIKKEPKIEKIEIILEVKKGENLNRILQLQKIYFKRNSLKLSKTSTEEIDKVIRFLKKNINIKLEVRNYTDAVGSAANNLRISAKRAQVIKNYMASKGIDPLRIQTKGMGETSILNRCVDGVKCSEKEHSLNRRTEFIIL